MRKQAIFLITTVLIFCAAEAAYAAQYAYLELKVNGRVIEGDSPVTSLDRVDKIQVIKFTAEHSAGTTLSTSRASAKISKGQITIAKLVDKSSPLLVNALAKGQKVDEAIFRFYRTNPGGGATQLYYTITITGARISGIKTVNDKNASDTAALEEVTFDVSAATISYKFEPTRATGSL